MLILGVSAYMCLCYDFSWTPNGLLTSPYVYMWYIPVYLRVLCKSGRGGFSGNEGGEEEKEVNGTFQRDDQESVRKAWVSMEPYYKHTEGNVCVRPLLWMSERWGYYNISKHTHSRTHIIMFTLVKSASFKS